MKQGVLMLIVLTSFRVYAAPADSVEAVTEEAWVAGVEALRLNCGHDPHTVRTLLEEYDPKLLRQYFLHFEPRDVAEDLKGGIRDTEWKLMGLAMYGKREDLKEMKSLEAVLSNLPTEPYGQLIQNMAQPALMAREGNPLQVQEAMEALAQVPYWFVADSLLWSGGLAARDKLLEIVKDPSIRLEDRCAALSALDLLDDPRRLDAMLLPDFIDQLRQRLHAPDDETLLESLARGKGMAELKKLKSIEALRELVKQGFKLPPREVKKKTVRGGIDWSKYWKQTSRTPAKTASASAPKRIEQPKPEKPVASVPVQEPPANNAGALIAAGAAIVGVLAVLIWFRRRK